METRILGRTGLTASVFGFGGIVVRDMPQREADRVVAEALERGVNYFDVAPSYGNAQDMLGPALAPYRSRALLACKSEKRDKRGLLADLHASLRTLQTDYFDVYQLHGLTDPGEIDQALAPGGALEALTDARAQGLVRYIGFSSHADEAALTLLRAYDFDTMLFPVNWALMLRRDTAREPLRLAAERNMARLAIKGLAFGPKPEGGDGYDRCWYHPITDDLELADLALRFTLEQDVHVAMSPGDERMLRTGLDILERYGGNPPPLSDGETETLRQRAQTIGDRMIF